MAFLNSALRNVSRFYARNQNRVIHSIKTGIACLIGLGLVKYFNWPTGQWVPITIIVVMSAQAHFGAALQKAYMRFLGTFAGVITTILTLLLFGNDAVAMFVVVFLACMFFTFIASSGGNISYAGTLGGVTVILTLTGTQADVSLAVMRGLSIVTGIVIALLVSRFIFPIHARERLRKHVAQTLRNLHEFYLMTVQIGISPNAPAVLGSALDKIIVDDLTVQQQLLREAIAGSRYFKRHQKSLFEEIIYIERKIYRLMFFICKELSEDQNVAKMISKIPGIVDLHLAIENSLNHLADCIENCTAPQADPRFHNLLHTIMKITENLQSERDTQRMLDEHSFLFFLEQLVKEIDTLYKVLGKNAHPPQWHWHWSGRT